MDRINPMLRFIVAWAVWKNLAEWLKDGIALESELKLPPPPPPLPPLSNDRTWGWGLERANFEQMNPLPGKLGFVCAFPSRAFRLADIALVFGTDMPDISRYCDILTAAATRDWEVLSHYPCDWSNAHCYVRVFAFGDGDERLTVIVLAIYTKDAHLVAHAVKQ